LIITTAIVALTITTALLRSAIQQNLDNKIPTPSITRPSSVLSQGPTNNETVPQKMTPSRKK
jgi:hypothetical protein